MDDPADYAETEPPGVPRWVKVAGLLAVILLLMLVVVMLLSGGDHGPGRHS